MVDLALERLDGVGRDAELLAVRSPVTGIARALLTPQYVYSASSLLSLPGRTRKCTTEPRRASSVLTSRLPMKPVAPVTKYCMDFPLNKCLWMARA